MFLSSRGASDRPLALVIGLCLPHNPLICSKSDFDFYMSKIESPEPMSRSYLDSLHPAMRMWRERRGVDNLTPEQNRRGLAAYYGLVAELDRSIGRIVEAIRDSLDLEDTIIVYTSDHGDMACEHGMWWKSSFYDGSARVPLIIASPHHRHGGEGEYGVVSLIDVGPTVLDIAGAQPLPGVTGRSFQGLLSPEPAVEWLDEVYCEYSGLLGDHPACMIRSGVWKLNYYSEFDSCQLFNMQEDPAEEHDIAQDLGYRRMVAELRRKILSRWSADNVRDALSRQNLWRTYLQSCCSLATAHDPPVFVPPAGSNEFDFSQLPKEPSGPHRGAQ